jgi:molecular chaperone DnaK (HSP70)
MRSLLVSEFNKQHGNLKGSPITSNKRAMAKLLREAREAKEQLSASPMIQLHVEEVYEGRDLKLVLNREQLEAVTAELYPKLVAPIQKVLQQAGLKAEDITGGIELFGGGVRVPKVQSTLREAFPNLALHKHIDGDESAVFGAGHYLAVLNGVKSATPVTVTETQPASGGLGQLNQAQQDKILKSLKDWDAREEARRQVDAAKNDLESMIAATKEQINNDAFAKANVDVRSQIEQRLQGAQEFMDSAPSTTTPEDYKNLLETLKTDISELMSKATVAKKAEAKKPDAKQEAKAAEENKRRQRERQRDRDKAKRDHEKKKAQAEKAQSGKAEPAKPSATSGATKAGKKKPVHIEEDEL